jgi:hypothetical protein
MTAMLSLLALPVLAQTYVGIKGGPLNISRDIPFDDGAMMGFLVGYDVPDNNFSVEGEFNTTVSRTLAFYGVYRSSGRFYFKGKAGLLYEYLNSSVTGIITIDVEGSAIALSFGIGGGMRISEKLSAEIEYTSIEADIGYATAGLNWMF